MKKKPKEFDPDKADEYQKFTRGPNSIIYRFDGDEWDDESRKRARPLLATKQPDSSWIYTREPVRGRMEDVILVPFSFLPKLQLKPKQVAPKDQIFETGKQTPRHEP